jgi:hypothetical protein
MMAQTPEISAELLCHRCEYDLRAHPPDGRCPECGEPVAESRRIAAIPRRPAWQDSDPRWRRRMLAGVWVLVLLPLVEVFKALGWASSVPAPTVFDFRGAVNTLDDTVFFDLWVYQSLVFCIGVVLLFSKERGRRVAALDWTRRWGVICSYCVLLLSAAQTLFIAALVLAGISFLFLSMPAKHQPEVTDLFARLSWAYLRYGPYPTDISGVVLVGFSSVAILLAWVPLFNALRSSGPRWVAAVLLAPLAAFSLAHLAQAGLYSLGIFSVDSEGVYHLWFYFRPQVLVGYISGAQVFWMGPGPGLSGFLVEATKWCIILAIAIWLTIAQFAAWRRRNDTSTT